MTTRASYALPLLLLALAGGCSSDAEQPEGAGLPDTATTGSVASTAADDSAAVASTVERYHAALASSDSAGALALLHPEVVVLESGGLETRAEYEAHHLSADMEFAQAVASERTPPDVTVNGDVAWAASTSTTRGTFREQPINSVGAELMVLTREGGDWKIAAIHWSSRNVRP